MRKALSFKRRLAILCMLVGFALVAKASYIHIKAGVAQLLISSAWEARAKNQLPAKPWPWADTWPVAKIEIDALGVTQYIMSDVSGQSLAFGPGMLREGVVPGATGATYLAGHRDTHFKFLQDLHAGMDIKVSNYLGEKQRFVVDDAFVINTDTHQLFPSTDSNTLTLITCYPFNALDVGHTPLRYVVTAQTVNNTIALK